MPVFKVIYLVRVPYTITHNLGLYIWLTFPEVYLGNMKDVRRASLFAGRIGLVWIC